nr:hypothetical protein [Deltaproteobacteria bacterium]
MEHFEGCKAQHVIRRVGNDPIDDRAHRANEVSSRRGRPRACFVCSACERASEGRPVRGAEGPMRKHFFNSSDAARRVGVERRGGA